jgi:rhodanese-related sulfurtransferase
MLKMLSALCLLLLLLIPVSAVIKPEIETGSDGIPRITVEELKTRLDKKESIVIVDVRNILGSIIKGALHIPINEIKNKLAKLPKDKLIVTVCACSSEGTSGAAVKILQESGYTKVAALKGGQRVWEAAKYPIEMVKDDGTRLAVDKY